MCAALAGTSLQDISRRIEQALADPGVWRLVLDIASEGGSANLVHELHISILAARLSKPIVAVINPLATGSAYWLASAASQIVAAPGARLGGIDIVLLHQNGATPFSAARDRVIAAIGSEPPTLTNGHLGFDQACARDLLDTAVRDIARGRRVLPGFVLEYFAMGSTFDALDSIAAGMADRLAMIEEVLDETRPRRVAAGIPHGHAAPRTMGAREALTLAELNLRDRTFAIAFHEAGHAAAAFVSGCTEVAAVIGHGSTAGLAFHGRPANARDGLIIAMAGPLAEARHLGNTGDDFRTWPDVIRAAEWHEVSIDGPLATDAYRAAGAFIDEHWPAIERLACRLAGTRFVDHHHIKQCLEVS